MNVRKLVLPVLVLTSILSVTALSCSATSNLPNPFASATPTVTPTFTPTLTPTSTPTPTLTPTATPKPVGLEIQKVPGGGSHYIDYDAGFTIDIPAVWAAVKLDPEDIQAMVSSLAKDNSSLADAVQNSLKSQSTGFRIFGFDQNPDHYAHGYVSNFNVLMSSEAMATQLPLDMLIAASVDQIKMQAPQAKVNNLGVKPNAHGVNIGQVEIRIPFRLTNGTMMNTYEKQLIFQTKNALVIVTLSTPADKSSAVSPLFDQLIDQIQLMEGMTDAS